jgi:hypothetical protein
MLFLAVLCVVVPTHAFASVDGRNTHALSAPSTALAKIQANAGPPAKAYKDGEWDVYAWRFPDDVESKLKFNPRTGEIRSAVYYTHLRTKLKEAKADPAEVPTN